jgi:transcriptional regulator GlxA family with amidase domain
MQDGPTLEFLRRQAAGARAVLSVCTGSIVLAAAGLLDGRAATTHWKAIPRLRAYPAVTLREERWVRDGTIWTRAGVSAGIDLLLAFIAAEDGEEAASAAQAGAEYYPDGRIYRSRRSWAVAARSMSRNAGCSGGLSHHASMADVLICRHRPGGSGR